MGVILLWKSLPGWGLWKMFGKSGEREGCDGKLEFTGTREVLVKQAKVGPPWMGLGRHT